MKRDHWNWIDFLRTQLYGRVAAVLLAVPFLAGAVVAVMIKIGYAALAKGVPLTQGDWTVGVPLGALLGAALVAILVRSYQVYRGSQSHWDSQFLWAPWLALLGGIMGLAANAGR